MFCANRRQSPFFSVPFLRFYLDFSPSFSCLDSMMRYVHLSKDLRRQSKSDKRRNLFHQALRQSLFGGGGKHGERDTCIKKGDSLEKSL